MLARPVPAAGLVAGRRARRGGRRGRLDEGAARPEGGQGRAGGLHPRGRRAAAPAHLAPRGRGVAVRAHHVRGALPRSSSSRRARPRRSCWPRPGEAARLVAAGVRSRCAAPPAAGLDEALDDLAEVVAMRWWGWGEDAHAMRAPRGRRGPPARGARVQAGAGTPAGRARGGPPADAALPGRRCASGWRASSCRGPRGARVRTRSARATRTWCACARATPRARPTPWSGPRSAEEVAAVLAACQEAGVAVVPFGGGTLVVGGVEPLRRASRAPSRSTCAHGRHPRRRPRVADRQGRPGPLRAGAGGPPARRGA